MKNLPKVFANKIEKNINNTQNMFYGTDRGVPKKMDEKNIVHNSFFHRLE